MGESWQDTVVAAPHPAFLRVAFVATCCVASMVARAGSLVEEPLNRQATQVRRVAQVGLIGAALAGQRIVVVGERGIAAYSDDGASTWHQSRVPVSVTLTAVRFADVLDGFAVGHGGVVLSTSNGGRDWNRRVEGSELAKIALRESQARHDLPAVASAERLVREGADKPLLDVEFIGAKRAVVVGAYGLAFGTEDGGLTWTNWMGRLENPKGLHLYAARRLQDRLLIVGEQGLILYSTDLGRAFRPLTIPFKGSLFTAELRDDAYLFVAGLEGNAWESSDDGKFWKKVAVPETSAIVASTTNPRGELVLASQAGHLFSRSGSGPFSAIKTENLPPLNGVLAVGDSLVALSGRGVHVMKGAAVADERSPPRGDSPGPTHRGTGS